MAAYIPGYVNSMDVLGFGFTTQSAMFYQSQHAAHDVHQGVQCDGCGANPLRGIRWHCQSCPDHDICNNCKKQNVSAGHPLQIMSMTSTNNANAAATGGQIQPEAMVHWTTCRGCGANPIRSTLYACTVCPNYDMCQTCNTKRIQNPDQHPHRFDFFVMPRPQNATPQAGGRIPGGPPTQHSYPPPPALHSYPPPPALHAYPPPPMMVAQPPPPVPPGMPPPMPPSYGPNGQFHPGTQYNPNGYNGPPGPPGRHKESTTGRIVDWLNKHLEVE